MRKLSAHFIYDGLGNCFEKGIIEVDNQGTIVSVTDTQGKLREEASIEFFSGVITPGFVNAHCHLELSHLYESIKPHPGLPGFLREIVSTAPSPPERIKKGADVADITMWHSGIQAVGDISNRSESFEIKKRSKIFYHTFIELLGFDPAVVSERSAQGVKCMERAAHYHLSASYSPHSPYATSAPLLQWISDRQRESNQPITMHNQESAGEDELFRNGKGAIADHLVNNLKIGLNNFKPTGKSALNTVLPLLPTDKRLLLVHNTYTTLKDIGLIRSLRPIENCWFVLCPGSNLYIEERLPDINLFRDEKLQLCLGTDSLASNNHLSILEEMKLVQQFFDHIPLAELVVWATLNGARALGIDEWAGSIEPGKRPGINLITHYDHTTGLLKRESKVKRLV